MSLKAKFMPDDEKLQTFSYSVQKKISALVTGNIICSIMFIVLAAAMIPMKKIQMGCFLVLIAILFIVSNFLSKKGKVRISS